MSSPSISFRLWGRANSTNVKKVLWCARECGFHIERRDAGGPFGGLDDPGFLAKNPFGEIPVLEHEDLVLRESNAIVRYLSALKGEPLYLQNPAARARADLWMDWSSASLMPFYKTIFYGLVRVAPEYRDHAAIADAHKRTCVLLSVVDDHLSRFPYLSGDRFGMGDIPLGCMIYALIELGIGRSLRGLNGWYERLRDRDSYLETVAIPLT